MITLEKFDIDYRSDGSVGQYRSILTESDLDGRIEKQQEIYVNEPMRFGGVTIYQVCFSPPSKFPQNLVAWRGVPACVHKVASGWYVCSIAKFHVH